MWDLCSQSEESGCVPTHNSVQFQVCSEWLQHAFYYMFCQTSWENLIQRIIDMCPKEIIYCHTHTVQDGIDTQIYKGDPRPHIPPCVMALSAMGLKLWVFGFLSTRANLIPCKPYTREDELPVLDVPLQRKVPYSPCYKLLVWYKYYSVISAQSVFSSQ